MTDPSRPHPIGWLVLLVRVALGGLFVFAASMKLSDLPGFIFSVNAFDVVPKGADHIVMLLTYVVPWTEMIVGVALILGLWTRAAAMLLTLVLVAFICGIVSVLARHMTVSCGCFGRFEVPCSGPIGNCQVVRNSVLLLASLFVVWKGPGSLAIDRQST